MRGPSGVPSTESDHDPPRHGVVVGGVKRLCADGGLEWKRGEEGRVMGYVGILGNSQMEAATPWFSDSGAEGVPHAEETRT